MVSVLTAASHDLCRQNDSTRLIALLIAFTFNLDQPQWSLLTVFIVSQVQQSGRVLAKSSYRVVGTLIGAAVALLLVAVFAPCSSARSRYGLAFAPSARSQYARDFSAYAFILSGYTAAIVGVPGALSANDAFYIATARITEICLGIKDGDGAEPEHPAPKGQIRTWLAGYFHRRYGAAAA
jgi:uncharacterized membrane protein YccC